MLTQKQHEIHIIKNYKNMFEYDKYIEYTYPGNKYFLINAIQYLCDNTGVTSLNAKTLKLRMLDKDKIKRNHLLIQLSNIIFPLLLILWQIYHIITYRKTVNQEFDNLEIVKNNQKMTNILKNNVLLKLLVIRNDFL